MSFDIDVWFDIELLRRLLAGAVDVLRPEDFVSDYSFGADSGISSPIFTRFADLSPTGDADMSSALGPDNTPRVSRSQVRTLLASRRSFLDNELPCVTFRTVGVALCPRELRNRNVGSLKLSSCEKNPWKLLLNIS